ncbi:hypothetical protein D3C85_1771410 [compost metagenome]
MARHRLQHLELLHEGTGAMAHQGDGAPVRLEGILHQERAGEGRRHYLLDRRPVELVAPNEVIRQRHAV